MLTLLKYLCLLCLFYIYQNLSINQKSTSPKLTGLGQKIENEKIDSEKTDNEKIDKWKDRQMKRSKNEKIDNYKIEKFVTIQRTFWSYPKFKSKVLKKTIL
jgi:hypothetical protein